MSKKFHTKIVLTLSIALCSTTAIARDGHHTIDDSTELKDWCQNQSAQYFLAKDITPYNWTASWWDKGNFLFVKGGLEN